MRNRIDNGSGWADEGVRIGDGDGLSKDWVRAGWKERGVGKTIEIRADFWDKLETCCMEAPRCL